uniref:Uncharacterized protein n=1 Tax=Arundo donax TaxID=35708 RepID=A0A0A9FK51_ARUDO
MFFVTWSRTILCDAEIPICIVYTHDKYINKRHFEHSVCRM